MKKTAFPSMWLKVFLGLGVFCAALQLGAAMPAPVLKTNPGGCYTETLATLDVLNSNYTRPPDNPTSPGDVFNPPVASSTPAAGAPQIGIFTRQGGSDQSINLFGKNFSSASIWAYRQTNSSDGQLYKAELLVKRNEGLTAVLGTSSAYGMTMVWVENASGQSYPVRINATEAWWVGPEYGQTGGTISVYGRNLSYQNGNSTSNVYMRPWGAGSGVPSVACVETSVSPYKVSFTIPSGLATGTDYEVWVHNGHGGVYGWSGPLKLRVEPGPHYAWNGTIRDVPAPSGNDDRAAIQGVINAAQPGDIVRFGSGTWLISGEINTTKSISIEGAGTSTVIRTMDIFSGTRMLFVSPNGVRVKNIQFECTKLDSDKVYRVVHGASAWGTDPLQSGLVFEGLTIISPAGSTYFSIEYSFCRDIYVSGCTFIGGAGIWGVKTWQSFIHNNAFYGNAKIDTSNAGGNGFLFWGTREMDFSFNTGDSYDRAGGLFNRRLFILQNSYGVDQDIYVGDNIAYDSAPLLGGVNQNSGEQILLETGNTHFTGKPTAVGDLTLTFSGTTWTTDQFVTDDRPGWNNGEIDGSYAYIHNGPGAGQWRKIIANTANQLTIDRPWDVPPDTQTSIDIQEMAAHQAIYHNTVDADIDDNFNGVPDYRERYMASVGIALFGSVSDVVVASNIISGMREGMYCWGFVTNPNWFEVAASILFTGNSITDCNSGINVRQVSSIESVNDDESPILLDVVVRGNTLLRAEVVGLSSDYYTDYLLNGNPCNMMPSYFVSRPLSQQTIFEGNNITDSAMGVRVGKHDGWTVVRKNTLSQTAYVPGSIGIYIDPDSIVPVVTGNTYSANIDTFFKADSDMYGCLANWRFDAVSYDGQSGDVHDYGPLEFNARSWGGIVSVPGRLTNAARFDGINDYVTIDQPFCVDSLTVSAWFKINAAGPSSSHYVFCSDNLGNSGYKGIRFFYSGYIVQIVGENGSTGNNLQWDVRPFAGDGKWHHVALTYDAGTQTAKVYGDFVLRDSITVNLGRIKPVSATGTPLKYFIGSRCAADSFFNGDIESVSIWNRALAEAEIKGAVAHWGLDEESWTGSENEVVDSSGNGFHGQALNGVVPATGKILGAAQFDGDVTNMRAIKIPHSLAFDNLTVSAWFKINGAGSSSNHYVFCSDSLESPGYSGIGFFSSGYILRIIGEGGSSGDNLQWDVRPFSGDGLWHHVVLTYDAATQTAKVYGDGILRSQTSVQLGRIKPANSNGSLVPYYLGARNCYDSFFNGKVDEVMLYDRALTEAEITALWNGPVAFWKMEEAGWKNGLGETRDTSSYRLNATPTGGANTDVAGRSGRAAKFNGTSTDKQTVKIPFPLEFDSLAISSWFKVNGAGSSSSHYVFCSDSLGNSGYKGIRFFYSGYIVQIVGENGSTGNNLQWDVRPFSGDGLWHHVALTYDATTQAAKVYGDGILRSQISVQLGRISPLNSNNGNLLPYFIGSRGLDSYFNGGVDEVRIYDRALSQSEITDLYNNP